MGGYLRNFLCVLRPTFPPCATSVCGSGACLLKFLRISHPHPFLQGWTIGFPPRMDNRGFSILSLNFRSSPWMVRPSDHSSLGGYGSVVLYHQICICSQSRVCVPPRVFHLYLFAF